MYPDRPAAFLVRILSLVVWLFAFVPCPPASAAPRATTEERAVECANRAARMAKEDDFDGAIRNYRLAWDLVRDPVLLYNIARMHDRKGDLATARDYYERYLADEKDPEGLERGRKRLQELILRLPSRLVVETDPAGATVEIDGATVSIGAPIELPGGAHQVRASLPGRVATVQDVVLKPGESASVRLVLEAAPVVPKPDVRRAGAGPWPWVCIGVGAGALGGGGVMTWLAGREGARITGAPTADGVVTGMSRTEALAVQGRAGRYDHAGWALYATGGAAVAAGIVLLIVLPRQDSASDGESSRAALSVLPADGGGTITASGRF